MKHCPKCNNLVDINSFYLRKSGPRSGEYYEKCKDCMKVRGRKYYYQNHDRQLKLALIRKSKSYYEKRAIINALKDVPCVDCGMKFPPCVMDFDHEDRRDKIDSISHMLSHSIDVIMKEISKCDIVCANCHRIRTFSQLAEIAKVVKAGA
jgi:hypothetical protein